MLSETRVRYEARIRWSSEMASNAQIRANRRNATRSTGPRTSNGKKNSSKNSVKHGDYSKTMFIQGENPEEFDALRADLESCFAPIDALDRELIHNLASSLWRLRRMGQQEAELIRRPQNDILSAFQMQDAEVRKKVWRRVLAADDALGPDDEQGIDFALELVRALRLEVPDFMDSYADFLASQDTEASWLRLVRRETSLQNAILRFSAFLHARRASRRIT